ncbi:Crp/Fnr family transcriptional regulator [Modicisalibacter tunisiensis]|uniref:Crp/Fnr family transcriptional regulator n=1 Tax=Modicisalibacter tunisiensis TaxID=390637 RepID=UPI001CCFEE55|nr:Crp/Fnr family transcriptional regulator [Modicisalibacter tunisiensis]MBZ9539391.1 Crp/Fnr family transcriptional regulator [Modicisalibacter tunisiensis]
MQDVSSHMVRRLQRFVSLTNAELALLADMERDSRAVSAGDWLWQEGDSADTLVVFTEGWGCSARYLPDGSRQLLEVFLPGDILGIGELVDGKRRSNVSMLTDGRISEYSYHRLRELFERAPRLRSALFVIANQRQAMLAERLVSIARRNARQRLAHFLCECHARLLEPPHDTRQGFLLPLSQQDLADALGMSPVHISRTFSSLACLGLVRRQHYHMLILDPVRLERLAGFNGTYLQCDTQLLASEPPTSAEPG